MKITSNGKDMKNGRISQHGHFANIIYYEYYNTMQRYGLFLNNDMFNA